MKSKKVAITELYQVCIYRMILILYQSFQVPFSIYKNTLSLSVASELDKTNKFNSCTNVQKSLQRLNKLFAKFV